MTPRRRKCPLCKGKKFNKCADCRGSGYLDQPPDWEVMEMATVIREAMERVTGCDTDALGLTPAAWATVARAALKAAH